MRYVTRGRTRRASLQILETTASTGYSKCKGPKVTGCVFRVGERMAEIGEQYSGWGLVAEVGGADLGHRESNDEAQEGGEGGLWEDGEGFLPHSHRQGAVPRPVFHVCALSSSPGAFPHIHRV